MENNPLPLVHNRANGLKNAVAQTLYQLMQTQSIDDISTRNLIAQAGIGVTSFYRHFRDKYDVVNWLHGQLLDQTLFRLFEGVDYDTATRSTWGVFEAHARFYRNAFSSRDVNNLRGYVYQETMRTYETILQQHDILLDYQQRVALELYVSGSVELTVRWVQEGCRQEAAPLLMAIKLAAPDFIRRYIE